jgi:ankyrin repeat protein
MKSLILFLAFIFFSGTLKAESPEGMDALNKNTNSFYMAILNQDLRALEELLKSGANPNVDIEYSSPVSSEKTLIPVIFLLTNSSSHQQKIFNQKALRLLLQNGADIKRPITLINDDKITNSTSLLIHSLLFDDFDSFDILIRYIQDQKMTLSDEDIQRIILTLISHGDLKRLKYLFAKGFISQEISLINVIRQASTDSSRIPILTFLLNEADKQKIPVGTLAFMNIAHAAYHYECYECFQTVLKSSLAKKILPTLRGNELFILLSESHKKGQALESTLKTMKIVSKSYPHGKKDFTQDGRILWHLFVDIYGVEIIPFLELTKKELNQQDSIGNTALHYATEDQKLATVKVLIDQGADMNIQNNAGNSPLLMLTEYAPFNSAHQILLDHGADIQLTNTNGLTLLHRLIANNDVKGVREVLLLIQANKIGKYHLETRNLDGIQPLHYAVIKHNLEIVKLLLCAGADVGARTDAGDLISDLPKRTSISAEILSYVEDWYNTTYLTGQSHQCRIE